MSITIGSTLHYSNEDVFINYNPWFRASLRNICSTEFNNLLHSDTFRYRVKDLATSEINATFSNLFRQHITSDAEWSRLKERLNAHNDSLVHRLNTVCDAKAAELLNSPQFEPLKTNIYNAAMNRYSVLEQELKNKNRQAEHDRNQTLTELNKKVESLEHNQSAVFFGGWIFGLSVSAIIAVSLSK